MEKTPELTRLAHFLDVFNKESERGAALLAGSILDEILLEILESFLIKGESAKVLIKGFNAPLGTFASRIKACHALGLIMSHEYEEIEIIRKIRNKFGHTWDETSFDDDEIKKLVEKLPWRGPKDEVNPTNQSKFSMATAMTVTDLMYRARLVKREQIKPKTWGHTTYNNSHAGVPKNAQPK